ncbi:MAG TPA: hypothetical protein VGD27_18715 [Longimicrobiales bacterium]
MKGSALSLFLLLAACGEPQRAPASSRDTSATTTENNSTAGAAGCEQFMREGLKLAARTRSALESEAGRPLNMSARAVQNRHVPAVQDSIFHYEYDGLAVRLRKAGPGGELFEQVIVTDRKWLNFPYFKPGVSAEKVIQALGEPQRRVDNRLIYRCGETEAEEPVVFEISEGTVQRIVFNYYVD